MDSLKCFGKIIVEQPIIEPKRIKTTYRAEGAKGAAAQELIFKYEEPILDADNPVVRNMAGLIVAMPLMNYGLFADELILEYEIDERDYRFFRDMLENTATEIYINKICHPNIFLKPEYVPKEFEWRQSYCRARLVANVVASVDYDLRVDEDRYAALSSGGKESLLSYGILNEIRQGFDLSAGQVFPVFYNESGRHWYTALNAYRWFKDNVPTTRRVWGNSDRLFAFMTRQMPFIREDFQRIRSDEYPIRLFTVEIMGMAAVPILYHEGIKNLIIGNEYDTSVHTAFNRKFHYDMLYDQSRYFDDYMTRYFERKGFNFHQFSILRSLSELLVERILGQRYPHLLRLQTSCHACHIQDATVVPCGKCEKCRRIMALLIANDLDPTWLHYSPEDIQNLQGSLDQRPLHQEALGSQHLYFLLEKKGFQFTRDGKGPRDGRLPREHPEIEKLRFDSQRSRVNIIPDRIRRPVLEILLQHSRGAVCIERGQWVDFDPLAEVEAPGEPLVVSGTETAWSETPLPSTAFSMESKRRGPIA